MLAQGNLEENKLRANGWLPEADARYAFRRAHDIIIEDALKLQTYRYKDIGIYLTLAGIEWLLLHDTPVHTIVALLVPLYDSISTFHGYCNVSHIPVSSSHLDRESTALNQSSYLLTCTKAFVFVAAVLRIGSGGLISQYWILAIVPSIVLAVYRLFETYDWSPWSFWWGGSYEEMRHRWKGTGYEIRSETDHSLPVIVYGSPSVALGLAISLENPIKSLRELTGKLFPLCKDTSGYSSLISQHIFMEDESLDSIDSIDLSMYIPSFDDMANATSFPSCPGDHASSNVDTIVMAQKRHIFDREAVFEFADNIAWLDPIMAATVVHRLFSQSRVWERLMMTYENNLLKPEYRESVYAAISAIFLEGHLPIHTLISDDDPIRYFCSALETAPAGDWKIYLIDPNVHIYKWRENSQLNVAIRTRLLAALSKHIPARPEPFYPSWMAIIIAMTSLNPQIYPNGDFFSILELTLKKLYEQLRLLPMTTVEAAFSSGSKGSLEWFGLKPEERPKVTTYACKHAFLLWWTITFNFMYRSSAYNAQWKPHPEIHKLTVDILRLLQGKLNGEALSHTDRQILEMYNIFDPIEN